MIRADLDCLLIIAPKILPIAPTPGAAKLKAVAEAAGLKVQTLDLNIKLWNYSREYQTAMSPSDTSFHDPTQFSHFYDSHLRTFFDEWLLLIAQANPRWVGISGLSYQSGLIIRKMCQQLRLLNPNIKIMLGGPGTISYGNEIKALGLADEIVLGDGEYEFLNLLGQDLKTSLPPQNYAFAFSDVVPNYDDFDLAEYSNELWENLISENGGKGLTTLFVTGSKGCVRNCSFCDVRQVWKKFSQKTPQDITLEIFELNRRYNVTNYFFTDSLMNGVKKSFDEFLSLMDVHNTVNETGLTFEGYMICRSKKDMPEDMFQKMKRAGLRKVYLGVETGSETVRTHMKKGYSRSDLDYFVEQMSLVGIQISLLLMVGYPTETEDDFEETLNMIHHYHRKGFLGPDKIIRSASFNWTTVIPEFTPLHSQIDELQIDMQGGNGLWTKENKYVNRYGKEIIEVNCPELRALRYKRLVKVLESYGIRLRNIENAIQESERVVSKNKDFFLELNKIKALSGYEAPSGLINGNSVLKWSESVISDLIYSMVYMVYDREHGHLYKIEGIMAQVGRFFEGTRTVNEILSEVNNQLTQKENRLFALFDIAFADLIRKKVLVVVE